MGVLFEVRAQVNSVCIQFKYSYGLRLWGHLGYIVETHSWFCVYYFVQIQVQYIPMTPLSKRPGPNLSLSRWDFQLQLSHRTSPASFRGNVWMGEFRKTCDLWDVRSSEQPWPPAEWMKEHCSGSFLILLSVYSQETPSSPSLRQTPSDPLTLDCQPVPQARAGWHSWFQRCFAPSLRKYTLSHSQSSQH